LKGRTEFARGLEELEARVSEAAVDSVRKPVVPNHGATARQGEGL
jgi:hypothetical protein